MTDVVILCAQCFAGAIQSVTDEWLDGKPVRGHFECDACGAKSGLWVDGGTVDVSDLPTPYPKSEFEVFTQCW